MFFTERSMVFYFFVLAVLKGLFFFHVFFVFTWVLVFEIHLVFQFLFLCFARVFSLLF